ncbi:hypothetical protein ABT332_13605 [Saccharomonospora azurea]|uniref:hypothetical protein n=1 Tax=Saccharomonospora azurea TaxID=40988 RepID=UPI0033181BBC
MSVAALNPAIPYFAFDLERTFRALLPDLAEDPDLMAQVAALAPAAFSAHASKLTFGPVDEYASCEGCAAPNIPARVRLYPTSGTPTTYCELCAVQRLPEIPTSTVKAVEVWE